MNEYGKGSGNVIHLGNPSPRRKRSSKKQLALIERRELFFDEYKKGLSYRQIAKKFKVSHMMVAHDVRSYLMDHRIIGIQNVSEYRQVQMERIQTAFGAIWPSVVKGNMGAVTVMVRLMEREAKLLGLDAPTKVDIRARIEALAREDGVNPTEALEIAEGVYKEISSG